MPQLTRIMHVDDASDIREVVRLALEIMGGFTIASCTSGEEALAKAPEFGPQLVLLDERMPGVDGQETFRRLREIAGMESVPVVFMTAQASPAEVARLESLGAFGVIAKPFDPMVLADRVRAIWTMVEAKAHDL